MKKDIEIPEVEGVYVAVVQEYNPEFEFNDWKAYIINDNDFDLEMVLIVSEGYDQDKRTSKMRHAIAELAKKSSAPIELMDQKVLSLNNEFYVTYFANGKMFEKKFLFRKNTINVNALRDIPLMNLKGVLVK